MSKQAQVQVQSAPIQVVPVTPVEQPFSLGETIKTVKKQWCSIKQQVAQSELYKTYDESRQIFGREFCTPVNTVWKNTYSQLPSQTTKLKFSYLEEFTFKERFLLLNTLAATTALLSLRRVSATNFFGKAFTAVRNASLSYIVGGLLIAPEIYNPLMSE